MGDLTAAMNITYRYVCVNDPEGIQYVLHTSATLRPFSTTFIADLFFLNVLLITDFIIYFIADICFIILTYTNRLSQYFIIYHPIDR